MTRTRRSVRLAWVVVLLALLAGCRRPTLAPPVIPPPADPQQVRFAVALFSIYHRARIAVGAAQDPGNLEPLDTAAEAVADGAPRFGQVWRVLAITQLAAAGIHDPRFRAAITELSDTSLAPKILEKLLAEHPGAELLARERIVYDFLLDRSRTFLRLDRAGLPDCPHLYPTADATSQNGLAFATMSAWVQKPTDDIAANLDPQNWDNPCGKLFFNATYLVDLQGGIFPVDPKTYDATPGTPEPVGKTWGSPASPRYLFEHYLLPTVAGDYFRNILSVETERTTDRYSIKTYTLASSIRSLIFPDEMPGGLYTDEGNASVTETGSSWSLLQGTKRVRFMTFPHHTADELADLGATMLKLSGTGFVYWACCPK